jgi:hypothetical protein
MNHKTVRLSITLREYGLLRNGLIILDDGLRNALMNIFPCRQVADQIDPVNLTIYPDRVFDAEMAQRIPLLWSKLRDTTATNKVRLDAFEISIAALALKISGSPNPRGEPDQGVEVEYERKKFARKLENYRRRARRASEKKIGERAYFWESIKWTKFCQWLRYNLLQFRQRSTVKSIRRMIWLDRRTRLESMISESLVENCYAPLSGEDMIRVVRLAKESILRGRQSMTLRETLESGQKGRDMLFGFVKQRLNLVALPGAEVPHWQQIVNRTDKFRAFQNSGCIPVARTPEQIAQSARNVAEWKRTHPKSH